MAALSPITLARFWSKVSVGDPYECWTWNAKKNEKGYGVFQDKKAHRVALELLEGPIASGSVVCHRCDNPSCCNPNHLFVSTIAANNADAAAKGRSVSGDRHPKAKLTDAQVVEIRESDLSGRALAKKYGVSESTISGVRCYRHRVSVG